MAEAVVTTVAKTWSQYAAGWLTFGIVAGAYLGLMEASGNRDTAVAELMIKRAFQVTFFPVAGAIFMYCDMIKGDNKK